MIYRIGQILVIFSLSLLCLAYANFAPTSLQSENIAGYVKNHFVREVIFGFFLTIWAIRLALLPKDKNQFKLLLLFGSIVVFPFWIAYVFGWAVQGLEEIWGSSINANAAYTLHGIQVVLFLMGMTLLGMSKKNETKVN